MKNPQSKKTFPPVRYIPLPCPLPLPYGPGCVLSAARSAITWQPASAPPAFSSEFFLPFRKFLCLTCSTLPAEKPIRIKPCTDLVAQIPFLPVRKNLPIRPMKLLRSVRSTPPVYRFGASLFCTPIIPRFRGLSIPFLKKIEKIFNFLFAAYCFGERYHQYHCMRTQAVVCLLPQKRKMRCLRALKTFWRSTLRDSG